MSRLRITCKREQTEARKLADSIYPLVNDRPPVFSDLELFVIDDNGETTPLTGVTRVEWIVEQGSTPARARIDFIGADVDVEVDLTDVVSRPKP